MQPADCFTDKLGSFNNIALVVQTVPLQERVQNAERISMGCAVSPVPCHHGRCSGKVPPQPAKEGGFPGHFSRIVLLFQNIPIPPGDDGVHPSRRPQWVCGLNHSNVPIGSSQCLEPSGHLSPISHLCHGTYPPVVRCCTDMSVYHQTRLSPAKTMKCQHI